MQAPSINEVGVIQGMPMAGIPRSWTQACASLIASLVLFCAPAAARDWKEHAFNAVAGVAHELIVAVGDKGLIMHFPADESPRQMPSGTDRDLLDVHVAAIDFAVAVGQGIVLLWDGTSWTRIVTEDDAVPYAQAWASPDKSLLLYGGPTDNGYRLCPRILGTARQPFCRIFSAPLRAVCGTGEAILVLLANGDFHRVNNVLIGSDGGFEPAFQPGTVLQLKSAWFSEESCDLQAELPRAFAVGSDGNLMYFDGAAWNAGPRQLEAVSVRSVLAGGSNPRGLTENETSRRN